MTQRVFTRSEIEAFNAGVEAVLAIARRTSTTIASQRKRRLHNGFAVAALEGLVDAGRALLMPEKDRKEAA